MLPLLPLPALASIVLPDAFWSLVFATIMSVGAAVLAAWRSSAVYEEKFSNQAQQVEQLKKDVCSIREGCALEASSQRLTALEVTVKNQEVLARDLLKYRETDVKELNRLISEIQQWMSRLETMIEYVINDHEKR